MSATRTPENRTTNKSGFTTKRDAQAFAATVEVSKIERHLHRARGRPDNGGRCRTAVARLLQRDSEGHDDGQASERLELPSSASLGCRCDR